MKEALTKALMEECVGAREVAPGEIAWESSRWRTVVRIAPEGRSGYERARIWSEPVSGTWPFRTDHLPALNALAALGGLVPSDDGRHLRLFSNVPLRHSDPEIADMLGHVALAAAVLQPLWLDGMNAKMAEAASGGRARGGNGTTAEPQLPPGGDDPSEWEDADFEGLAGELSGHGLLADGDATGLRAELPAGDGGSGFHEDRPAVVRLACDVRHPIMGHGLSCSLHLPLPGGEAELRDAVATLSRAEMREARAPLLGAWCEDVTDPDGVAFVSFFPNMTAHELLAPALVSWMATRAARATRLLAGDGD